MSRVSQITKTTKPNKRKPPFLSCWFGGRLGDGWHIVENSAFQRTEISACRSPVALAFQAPALPPAHAVGVGESQLPEHLSFRRVPCPLFFCFPRFVPLRLFQYRVPGTPGAGSLSSTALGWDRLYSEECRPPAQPCLDHA